MRHLLRRGAVLAIAFVLALALPIQGLAAATLLHCGQGGQPSPHSHHPAPAQAPTGGSASPSHHVHHHAMTAANASRHASNDTQKCSACAVCCMATALPVAIPAFTAAEPAGSLPRVAAVVDPVFLTGGPERPPRQLPT